LRVNARKEELQSNYWKFRPHATAHFLIFAQRRLRKSKAINRDPEALAPLTAGRHTL